VWLVSGQVRLSAAYGTLAEVLVALIVAWVAIGVLQSWRLAAPATTGVVAARSPWPRPAAD
jgi:hypothetical protein